MTRAGALVALAVLVAGCDRQPAALEADARFANLGPDAAFVGAASCATCHEDIAASYASHGMANSMQRWTADSGIEPLLETPIVDARTGFEYRVVEADGRLAQEERQLDADGREVARLVRPMDWVVGSGDAARTYFATRGDGLTQLPLTWYTQTSVWDWSPGYEDSNPRFGRGMPDGCMSCHNAVPETIPGVEGAFASIPDGIGCERCHGPGSLHVEARLASDGPADGPDPTIVNPKWLSLDLRLDVCSQCHLHASVDVLRQGETPYSYRPGRPLAAHEGLFALPGEVEGDAVAVVSHAARMQASACFQESVGTEAPLECTTCHDPHRGFEARPAGAQSAACASCHADVADAVPAALAAEHAAATGCVSCHMPRVEADTAPHSSFTDHWIRVVDGPVRAIAPETGRSGVVAPLDDRDRDGIEGGLYEGVAAITVGSRAADPRALAQGAQFVQIALDRIAQPERYHDARFLLGVALLSTGRAPDAIAPLRDAADAASPATRPQRLETLARALADAGRPADATFRRSIEAQPRRPVSHREYGRYLLAHDVEKAAERLAEAVRLDPWDAEAHVLLGIARAASGADGGDAWREAVRLDPAFADVLASGVQGSGPLWTAPDVFGWPRRQRPPAAGDRVDVFTSSGTRVAQGAWGNVAGRLASGIYVVGGPDGVRRIAVVST